MTTTDRMSNLDSRREITDRTGQTVILGNSVGSAALDAPGQIVFAAVGESRATAEADIDASFVMNVVNGSFGIWAVFWDIDTTALFSAAGGSITNSRLDSDAVAALSFGTNGGGLINVRSFSATTVYTPTPGTVSIVVECIGGGGGGGGAGATGVGQFSIGTGGGAGCYALARMTSGFSGQTITIGAGGAGAAAGANNGTAGGATSFGTKLIAAGGGGGNFLAATTSTPLARYGGLGGAASGTDSLFGAASAEGGTGYVINALSSGGYGANTIFGQGGVGAESNGGAVAGGAATGFGAGGGGGLTGPSQSAVGGGNGMLGICIVWEYNT